MWASRNDVEQILESFKEEILREYQQKHKEQLRAILDFNLLLTKEISSLNVPSDFFGIPMQINRLEEHIKELASAALIQPVSSEQKSIHEEIRIRIESALIALHTLENYHANWLQQHMETLYETQKSLLATQERLYISIGNISPQTEEIPVQSKEIAQ